MEATIATNLPAGPKGKWGPTLRLIRNPREAMESWVKEFGDPFLLSALNGPVVVTGREDLIRTIYGQSPDTYEPFAVATMAPLMGTGSMFVLNGEEHRRERRLVMPMFHGDRMKAYGLAMQEIAMEQLTKHDLRKPLLTKPLMIDISLEIIVRTVFGGDDRAMAQRMVGASHSTVAAANPLLFFSSKTHLSFLGLTPWDRWNQAKANLFTLFDQVIASRKANSVDREDILSLLCDAKYEDGQSIQREHIHAELMTFLFAGHETTALTLTWAIYHLHRNRQYLGRLRDELDSLPDLQPSTLAAAPYLKAVVQETLRIHPIVTETLRKLRTSMVLGEYTIPAGIAVAPATVLAHHNPQTYSDPDTFRPDRFLGRSYSPFEYMPFGGGHRRCIGAAFAGYEMAIVLGTLLARYEFELQEAREVVPKRRSVTIGPSSDVPVLVKTRR
ncbi:cytochrome P450 [Pirellulaceae bacterium SH449]